MYLKREKCNKPSYIAFLYNNTSILSSLTFKIIKYIFMISLQFCHGVDWFELEEKMRGYTWFSIWAFKETMLYIFFFHIFNLFPNLGCDNFLWIKLATSRHYFLIELAPWYHLCQHSRKYLNLDKKKFRNLAQN